MSLNLANDRHLATGESFDLRPGASRSKRPRSLTVFNCFRPCDPGLVASVDSSVNELSRVTISSGKVGRSAPRYSLQKARKQGICRVIPPPATTTLSEILALLVQNFAASRLTGFGGIRQDGPNGAMPHFISSRTLLMSSRISAGLNRADHSCDARELV